MRDLGVTQIGLWFLGPMFLASPALRFLHLKRKSSTPNENYFRPRRSNIPSIRPFPDNEAIDRTMLTETGGLRQIRACLDERRILIWVACGILLVGGFLRFHPVEAWPLTQVVRHTVSGPDILVSDQAAPPAHAASGRARRYIAAAIVTLWLIGVFVLATQSRNQIRLALNNRTPEAKPGSFTRFGFRKLASHIDPTLLEEAGRRHLKNAARSERFLFLWMLDGLLLVVIPLVGLL